MGFKAKRCKAISQSSGKRCRQPAVKGFDFCRFHLDKEPEAEVDAPLEKNDEPKSKGGQAGNRNAVKHGAYSLNLLPEEEPIYRERRDNFLGQLGKVDIFDEQVVHMLALISTKLDVAATQGAPAQALIPISNEILKLLRSLKETRDSRDPEEEETPGTMADFLAELAALEAERGILPREEDARRRMHELEVEVNELLERLGLPSRDDIEHCMGTCGHCRKTGEQRRNTYGDWVCMACGSVMPKAGDKKHEKESAK